MNKIRVSEIMSQKPVMIKSGESITAAAKKMKDYRISSLIITSQKELRGIITVDDIVRRGVARNIDLNKTKIDNIMTDEIITVNPNDNISEVIEIFNEYQIRQAPVLDETKKIVGFITFKDILVYNKGEILFSKEIEQKAASVLGQNSFKIICDLGVGNSSFTAWGCDLGYEYVKINADYRT
jgi:CBS domain-containing protein